MATTKKKTPKDNKSAKKKKGIFLKIAVTAVLLQAFVYIWVHLFLSYKVGVEIAPTTSVAFFSFCVGEAGFTAWIETRKKKGD